jgi:hypothetical protein
MNATIYLAMIAVLGLVSGPLAANEGYNGRNDEQVRIARAMNSADAGSGASAAKFEVLQTHSGPDIDVYLSFHEQSVSSGPRALRMPWSEPPTDAN